MQGIQEGVEIDDHQTGRTPKTWQDIFQESSYLLPKYPTQLKVYAVTIDLLYYMVKDSQSTMD